MPPPAFGSKTHFGNVRSSGIRSTLSNLSKILRLNGKLRRERDGTEGKRGKFDAGWNIVARGGRLHLYGRSSSRTRNMKNEGGNREHGHNKTGNDRPPWCQIVQFLRAQSMVDVEIELDLHWASMDVVDWLINSFKDALRKNNHSAPWKWRKICTTSQLR